MREKNRRIETEPIKEEYFEWALPSYKNAKSFRNVGTLFRELFNFQKDDNPHQRNTQRGRPIDSGGARDKHRENIKRQLFFKWEFLRRNPEYLKDSELFCSLIFCSLIFGYPEKMSEKETQMATKYGLIIMTDPEISYANIDVIDFPFRLYINPIWPTVLNHPRKGKGHTSDYPYNAAIGINLLFPIKTIESELRKSIFEIINYRKSKGIYFPKDSFNKKGKEINKKKIKSIFPLPSLPSPAIQITSKDWLKSFALIEFNFLKYSIKNIIILVKSIRDKREKKGELKRIKKERFKDFDKYLHVYDLKYKSGYSFKQIEKERYKLYIPKTNKFIIQKILNKFKTPELRTKVNNLKKLMIISADYYWSI